MISAESQRTVKAALQIYDQKLRDEFEREHAGKYLCIEPVSGDYFLGESFDAAVNAALDAYPDRLTHTLRVSRPPALRIENFFGESLPQQRNYL